LYNANQREQVMVISSLIVLMTIMISLWALPVPHPLHYWMDPLQMWSVGTV